MDYLQVGAYWLHLVATVVFLGCVVVIGALVLPVLRRETDLATACRLLTAFERRAVPAIIAALVAFLATGVYLTISDARYGGAGNVTGSTWASIVAVKHVLVVVLVGLGLYVDGVIARTLAVAEAQDRAAALGRVTVVSWIMIATTAAVLGVTALAQSAP